MIGVDYKQAKGFVVEVLIVFYHVLLHLSKILLVFLSNHLCLCVHNVDENFD